MWFWSQESKGIWFWGNFIQTVGHWHIMRMNTGTSHYTIRCLSNNLVVQQIGQSTYPHLATRPVHKTSLYIGVMSPKKLSSIQVFILTKKFVNLMVKWGVLVYLFLTVIYSPLVSFWQPLVVYFISHFYSQDHPFILWTFMQSYTRLLG